MFQPDSTFKKSKRNNVAIYVWRYEAGPGFTAREQDDVQMAVQREDWPAFKEILQRLKDGQEQRVMLHLRPLPAGQPHHLDSGHEVFDFPNQQYAALELVRSNEPTDEVSAYVTSDDYLQIRATEAGCARLLTLLANAARFASIYENVTHVRLPRNNAAVETAGERAFTEAKLVMWGVNDVGEIVYS